MNTILDAALALPFVASLTLKGAILLGLAWAVVSISRKTPAADRHAVWIAALGVVLVLPVISVMIPEWHMVIPVSDTAEIIEVPVIPMESAEPIVLGDPVGPIESAVGTIEAPAILGNYGVQVSSWISPLFADWQLLLGVLWIFGVLIIAGRWLFAYVSAHRMVREATPVVDESWLDRAYELGFEMGAPEDVYLFSSDRLAVPVAWCFGRPVIILPGDYHEFNEELRDIVLRHELAHIVRRDGWTQVIAQISVAIHWFNPLAWLAWQRMLIEREQACDDMVLESGTTPSTYADYLMQISKRFQSPSLALAAVASMARHSDLHTRVMSILDSHRSRHSMRGLPALMVALLALPLAAFQLGLETVEPHELPQEIVEVMDIHPVPEVVQEVHANDWTWNGRVSSNGEVEIHSINGAVNVRQGRGNNVEVVARMRQERNDGARLEVVERGGSVVVCIMHNGLQNCAPGGPQGSTRGNQLSEVEVTVTMPAGVSLRVETVNGAVTIPDHDARVRVHTVNGRVSAQSSGSIRAETTNGAVAIVGGSDIQISTTNGAITLHSTASRSGNYSVNASTTNGAVTARFDHTGWQNNASFSTNNGRIRIELPAQPNTTVDARSSHGSITSDLPLAIERSRSRTSAIGTFGNGGRGLILQTTHGAIQIVSGGRTSSAGSGVYDSSMAAVEVSTDIISGDWISDVVETSLAAARVALDDIDLSHLSREERQAALRDLEAARLELASLDFSEIRTDLDAARVEMAQAFTEINELHTLFENLDFSHIFDHMDEIFRQVELELEIVD